MSLPPWQNLMSQNYIAKCLIGPVCGAQHNHSTVLDKAQLTSTVGYCNEKLAELYFNSITVTFFVWWSFLNISAKPWSVSEPSPLHAWQLTSHRTFFNQFSNFCSNEGIFWYLESLKTTFCHSLTHSGVSSFLRKCLAHDQTFFLSSSSWCLSTSQKQGLVVKRISILWDYFVNGVNLAAWRLSLKCDISHTFMPSLLV